MKKYDSVRKITVTAVCIALCCVLPTALHAVGLGQALSPLHLPVLLCGVLCGGVYGLFCGIAGPVLSSLITGMPPAMALATMVPELLVYGLVTGVMLRLVRTKNLYVNLYIALITAMILGRVAGGVASAFVYTGRGEAFTLAIWAASYFVGTLPGMVSQLILIPLLVFTLMKARIIPVRYTKGELTT